MDADAPKRGWLERVAPRVMLVLPAFAVAATAIALLGPGRERPAPFALVYGAPYGGHLALRIATATRALSVDAPVQLDDVEIDARASSGKRASWRGATGPDGIAEVALDVPGFDAVTIEARSRGRPIARGEIDRSKRAWMRVTDPAWIQGAARGELEVEVAPVNGVLAVPFPDTLVVYVTRNDRPVAGAHVTLDAPGADLEPSSTSTDDHGVARVRVTPRAHVVLLDVAAATDAMKGSFEGNLPIKPGALVLERDGARAQVVSPAPHPRAYLSFWRGDSRVGGAIVPLAERQDGMFAGTLDEAATTLAKNAEVTIATDPDETDEGMVTWAHDGGRAFVPRIRLLIDGAPNASAFEGARAGRARLWAGGVLLSAACAEILILLWRSRVAQRRLEQHLAEAASENVALASKTSAGGYALISVALVALGFSIVAVLAAFR